MSLCNISIYDVIFFFFPLMCMHICISECSINEVATCEKVTRVLVE